MKYSSNPPYNCYQVETCGSVVAVVARLHNTTYPYLVTLDGMCVEAYSTWRLAARVARQIARQVAEREDLVRR